MTKKTEKSDRVDLRGLSRVEREQLRRQCIRLREKGMGRREISELLQLNPTTISIWWSEYQKQGKKFFKLQQAGKRKGTGKLLTSEQEGLIRRLITDKTPDQLKFPFALWDRKAVQLLIRRELGVEVAIRTVGNYLHDWGFTPQKPLKRAYEQNEKQVKRWLEEAYPQIKQRAKEEKAEIHWGDETGLRNTTQHGRSYAPRGKTPVQRVPAKRVSTNIISTVTNQGKVRFMGYHGSMNAQVLIRFFRQLIKNAPQKIYLILDNLRVHHSKVVKVWLQKHQEKIEVFYLPSYSPELNPDEYLNGDLKAGVHSKTPALTVKDLAQSARSHLRYLQKNPERVKSYFQHPSIAYAAADEEVAA